jgi:Tfp pilus assembly protein PilF
MAITRTAVRLLLSSLLISVASVAAYAQADVPNINMSNTDDAPGVGSISGQIVLPSGHPVSNRIRIALSTANDPGMAIYTDTNGMFSFVGLRPGTYYVEVSGDSREYDLVTEQVRLFRGMKVNLMIPLREKEEAVAKRRSKVVSLAELEQKVPGPARKEFERGVKLVDEGKPLEAIPHFEQAIAIFPDYVMAHNDLGVQFLNLKRAVEAQDQFEIAIGINPRAYNPRLNLAISLIEQKKYLSAIDSLNVARAIDASSPAIHLYMGIAMVETDDLETADRELRTTLSIGGEEFVVARFYLAQVHLKRGDRIAAARELKAYLVTAPTGEEAARARVLLERLKGLGG